MRSRFSVTFEDGHSEVFVANEVQYAGGGLIIQERITKRGEWRTNLQTGQREQELEVTVALQAVIAPPRPDMAPELRWCRVSPAPALQEDEEALTQNGEPALTGQEVRN